MRGCLAGCATRRRRRLVRDAPTKEGGASDRAAGRAGLQLSLRGAAIENAVGLLKEELARLDSIIVLSAREAAVPAGGALAVDRVLFAQAVEERIEREPLITLHREAIDTIPLDRPVIVACGPLPSDEMLASIDALVGTRMHYFDAASPIVAADSLDETDVPQVALRRAAATTWRR